MKRKLLLALLMVSYAVQNSFCMSNEGQDIETRNFEVRIDIPEDYVLADTASATNCISPSAVAQKYWNNTPDETKSRIVTWCKLIATGALAFGTAQLDPLPAAVFFGLYGTQLKIIIPKSTDDKWKKIALGVSLLAAGIAVDATAKYGFGVDLHSATTTLGLGAGLAFAKRIEKGGNKEKAKKQKKSDTTLTTA